MRPTAIQRPRRTRLAHALCAAALALAVACPLPGRAAPPAQQDEPEPTAAVTQAVTQTMAQTVAQADRLKEEGIAAANEGDYAAAIEKMEQALALYVQAGDAEGAARATYNLGLIHFSAGEPAAAQGYFAESAPRLAARGLLRLAGAAYVNLGFIAQMAGDDEAARMHYAAAVPLLRRQGLPNELGWALMALADVQDAAGAHAEAEAALDEAAAAFAQAGEPENQALALERSALTYALLGMAGEALDRYGQAAALREQLGDPAALARTLRNSGDQRMALGALQAAAADYSRSIELLRSAEGDHRAQIAELTLLLGRVYTTSGDAAAARAAYVAARRLYRELGDRAGEAALLGELGFVLGGSGDYAAALAALDSAIALWEELGQPARQADAVEQKGVVLAWRGDPAAALTQYEAAIRLRRGTPDGGDPFVQAKMALRMMGAARALGDDALLRRYAAAFTRALQGVENVQMLALFYDGMANEAVNRGDLAGARFLLEQALALHENAGNVPGQVSSLFIRGLTYAVEGDWAAAAAAYGEALDRRDTLRTPLPPGAEWADPAAQTTLELEAGAVEAYLQLGRVADAWNVVERSRARTLLDQLGNVRPDVRAGAGAKLVARELELRSALAAAEERAALAPGDPSLRAALAALRADYQLLLNEMALASLPYLDMVAVAPLSLAETQARLPAGTALLTYFSGAHGLLAFVVTADSVKVAPLDASAAGVLDAARALEQRPGAGQEGAADARLVELYEMLVAPLAPLLEAPGAEIVRLGIIPAGPLHYVPFAALHDAAGSYLGEGRALFLLPSASMLKVLSLEGEPPPVPAAAALILAPDARQGAPALALAEAELLADMPGAIALRGDAASESSLRARAGQAALIHIAAHAELTQEQPMFSRIVLAPERAQGGAHDGLLEVHEIYGLDLARAELVTLSACQTALGGELSAAGGMGDEVAGFTRAFLYAGAPTVVTTLWRIDDAATAQLMAGFYANLAAGMGKAEALQAAQAAMRATPQYSHPYYWAAFVLTGEPGPVWAFKGYE